MPMTGLPTLEHPLALVAGDGLVEEPLLGARVVEVVIDHVVAERAARERSLRKRRDCVAQRPRESHRVGLVRVAFEPRWRLELALDPVETGGDERGEGEVRVDVSAGDPRLDAPRRATTDDAEPTGAVVLAPGDRRRRPRSGRVALVRVDRRSQEDR